MNPLPEPTMPMPARDPDHELPEVRHEQALHLRTFAGREALLDEVAHWIEDEAESGYLLLLGPPGQGKSALMAELARRLGERGGCLLHMIKSHRNPLKFVPALLSQASRLAGVCFGAEAYRGDLDDLRNALMHALETVRDRTGRALLLIDALDELEHSAAGIAFLPALLPTGTRAILTCRPDIPLVQALRVRLQPLEERNVPPLGEADLPHVLARRLGAAALSRLHGLVNWGELFVRLQGNPLFLHRALNRIARALEQDPTGTPRLDLDTLPTTLGALFQDICNEIAEKEGTRFRSPEGRQKARLLQFLCLAREALGVEELSGLMTADGVVLSLEDCRDRLFEMSAYLLDTGAERFKPWHQGLVDHVRERVLRTEGVRQLEEVFCRWLRTTDGGEYGLRHRLAHLLAAGLAEEAAKLLLDLPFLEARTEAGQVFDLARDFALIAAALPANHPLRQQLRLLEEALRTDLHFLERHPQALFQCLWNRCWWYDTPAAAPHYDMSATGWPAEGPPWRRPGPKLHALLESWRADKETRAPGLIWVRSLRPPPVHLGTRLRAVCQGHSEGVRCVAFSRDGLRLISGSWDRTIRLWDAVSGAPVGGWRAHEKGIASMALSYDGTRLVTGSRDHSARVWDADTGVELARFRGHDDQVDGVALTPDGRHAASCSQDGTVRIWDVSSAKEIACLRGHQAGVCAVAYTPDGTRLASTSWDGTVRIWDVARGVELLCLRGHESGVWGLAFSPDGRRLASGSQDRTVRLWDTATGKELACLRGHENNIEAVAFSPDGRRLASASWDRTVRLWDVAGAKELACLHGHEGGVCGVAFSPDGLRLASSSADRTVRVWDSAGGAELVSLRGHRAEVTCLALSPDGTRLASGGGLTVRIWDTARGLELARLEQHLDHVLCVTFSPNGTQLASGGHDYAVRLWDVATGKPLRELGPHYGAVYRVTFSPSGSFLASYARDRTVRIWDVATGKELAWLLDREPGEQATLSLALGADAARLVSGVSDQTVRVWNTASGTELACLRGHLGHVSCVALSPDGKRVASGSSDRTVRLWDVPDQGKSHTTTAKNTISTQMVDDLPQGPMESDDETEEVGVSLVPRRSRLRGHDGDVGCVAFSPDGLQLASGSRDQTIRIWDVESTAEVACLRGHEGEVTCVTFSPDGMLLASGSADRTVRLWDVAGGMGLLLSGHDGGVSSVAFSPDGRRAATGSRDWTVRIWGIIDGPLEICFRGHQKRVSSVVFSPDGRLVASGSADGTVRLWDIQAEHELACLRCGSGSVESVIFSSDGTRLFAGLADRTIWTWDVPVHSALPAVAGGGVAAGTATSPDGLRIAHATRDRSVRIVDAVSGAEVVCLRGHQGSVQCVAYSPDGKLLASGGGDRTVRLWEAASGAERACLHGHETGLVSLTFEPDGRHLRAIGWDGSAWRWRLPVGAVLFWPSSWASEGYEVTLASDGKHAFSLGVDRSVLIFDAAGRALLEEIPGRSTPPSGSMESMSVPFLVETTHLETAIRSAHGQATVWFPARLFRTVTHPGKGICAGAVANHVYLLHLDGQAPTLDRQSSLPAPSVEADRRLPADEARLEELLSQWQQTRSQGQEASVAELCRDCPELALPLQQRIAALVGVARLAAQLEETAGASPFTPDTPPVVPTANEAVPAIPGYEVLRIIGRGGMGVVYQARDTALNRVVALKMILAGGHASGEQRSRFRAEAGSLARLHHPHIVQVHTYGEHAGQPYFVMEYVEGGTVSGRLRRQPEAPAVAARLVFLVARAVHAAHQAGIIHRDLKPANILLAPPADEPALNSAWGWPKVTDFGLARHLDDPNALTLSGAVLGTPSYMAPEQAQGKSREIGPATDVWALGAILYELLTGRPPFLAETALLTLEQIRSQAPTPPSRLNPETPNLLEEVCLRCLEKEPSKRYLTAADLATELARFFER